MTRPRPNPRLDLPIPLSFACDAQWDDMLGSGTRRLCAQCNTQVVDISSLSEAEARKVLATPGVCVNYRVRGGRVVYAQQRRGVVDPEGPAVRALSRARARGRTLLRWAGAVAGAVAVLPGVAHAGAAASEELSSLERVRSWVASWFDDEAVFMGDVAPVEEVMGEAGTVDTGVVEPPPAPPRRYAGRPAPKRHRAEPNVIEVTVGAFANEVELLCGGHRERRGPDEHGVVHLSAPRGEACRVMLNGDLPGVAYIRETPREGVATCAIEDGSLTCR